MGRQWTNFEDDLIKNHKNLFSKTSSKLARELLKELRVNGYLRTIPAIEYRINMLKREKINSNIKGASYKPEWHKDTIVDIQDTNYLKMLKRYKFLYHLEILKKTFKYKRQEEIDWKHIEKLTSILNATSKEIMEDK